MSRPHRPFLTGCFLHMNDPNAASMPSAAGQSGFWRANLALALAGFSSFALLYGTQPVLPQLAQDFAISPAQASLSVTTGTAAMAFLLIPLSLIADRYGRERLMRIGLTGAALFAFASALAPNFALLLLFRAALGVCIAGVPAAAMAYLGEEIDASQRGQATRALHERLGRDTPVHYERDEALVCGVALEGGGHRLGWSVADYLQGLERRLRERLSALEAEPERQEPAEPQESGA